MGTTLFAMVKVGRGLKEYRKVLSTDVRIFSLPDNLGQSVDYNPERLLEDDEWYCISNFSSKSYWRDLPEKSSSAHDEINGDHFGNIVFIICQQDGLYHFQHITSQRQVKRKIIYFGERCKYEADNASIPLKDYADAIYDPTDDKLYFQKLPSISTIFDGIDELYREATDDEVREFLRYDFIELADEYTVDGVGKSNRKRITLSLEQLRQFTEEQRKSILVYIREYCPQIINSDDKFHINNEKDLTALLYGILERYHTTPVGEEQRIANSFISMSRGGKTDG